VFIVNKKNAMPTTTINT
jgi:hypothetical protein